jgi:hypothetical protein
MSEISERHIARFRRIARQMASLLKEIRETCPEANLYLEDSGNWNLMTGDSHDEKERQRQDRVVAYELVPHSGGGAW